MSRFNLEILIGIILVTLTTAILVYYGLNEEERMAQFNEDNQAQMIEVGASLFEANCSGCHGLKGEGIVGLCPPLNDAFFFTGRMDEVGWPGSIEDYIVSTISSGRTISTRPDQYPGRGAPAMPAWSEQYGGPLRQDQILSLAEFIMNWEETAVGDYVLPELPTPTPSGEELVDPVARGQQVYLDMGCGGCHTIDGLTSGTTGPNHNTIGTTAATRVEGQSAEEYIRQSILDPSAYVVQGFEDLMIKTYSVMISPSEMDDLVAFLLAQK